MPSSKYGEPMLEVIMIMVFLKSTVFPRESVIRPSSSTCNNTLNTSGCAFSISSKSTTEYGFLLTASVSWPPSSYPTYPGGAPIRRLTENFSIYSLISSRTILLSSSNKASAKLFASSVLPTPVGPRNRKEPIGLFGSLMPAFDLWMASQTFVTPSSWPITRSCNILSRCRVFCFSDSFSFATGILVQREIILAISSSVTASWTRLKSSFFTLSSSWANFFCNSGSFPYWSSAALLRSYRLCASWISRLTFSISSRREANPSTLFFSDSHLLFCCAYSSCNSASSFWRSTSLSFERLSVSFFSAASSISICMVFLLSSSSSDGIESISVLMSAQASSTKSMALSGRNLSVM